MQMQKKDAIREAETSRQENESDTNHHDFNYWYVRIMTVLLGLKLLLQILILVFRW